MSITPGPRALHLPFIHRLEYRPYRQGDVSTKLEDTAAHLLRESLKNHQDSLQ